MDEIHRSQRSMIDLPAEREGPPNLIGQWHQAEEAFQAGPVSRRPMAGDGVPE